MLIFHFHRQINSNSNACSISGECQSEFMIDPDSVLCGNPDPTFPLFLFLVTICLLLLTILVCFLPKFLTKALKINTIDMNA